MINLKKFLKDDLKVRHKSKHSNKFVVTINGMDCVCDNIQQLSEKISGNLSLFKNNINYTQYSEKVKQEISDPEEFFTKINKDISSALTDLLITKTDIKAKIENVKGRPSDMKFESLTAPEKTLNAVDLKILSGIKYCATDGAIYFKRNNTLRLIGQLDIIEKKPVKNGLCAEIRKNIIQYLNENTDTNLYEFISAKAKLMYNNYVILAQELQRELDRGNKWQDVELKFGNEKFIPRKYASQNRDNAVEAAAESFIIDYFWNEVPTSIFATRSVVLKKIFERIEILDGSGQSHKIDEVRGFCAETSRIDDIISEERYLKNFFDHFKAELMDSEEFRIEDAPRTYTDTDKFESLFKYDKDRFKSNWPSNYYTKFNDCENLKLLKSWMNKGEYRLAMAWAYAVLHPNTINSNIALLLWTGGGTGKSSFVAIIKEALLMASNAKPSDIYFEIKGENFDKDQIYSVPQGEAGIPYAALINIDEATDRSIEIYKNYSGTASGNRGSFKRLYEDSFSKDIYGKFIFTSNKGLQLTSDDGSLMRRIAIIKHKEIKNVIGRANKSPEEIQEEFRRQVPMLIYEGQKALKEIHDIGYESIDKYASECEDIAKNLRESTAQEANVTIYSSIWAELERIYSELNIKYENVIRIQAGALKRIYLSAVEDLGEDGKYWNSFKRFITDDPTFFTSPNLKKAMAGFIKLKSKQISDLSYSNFELSNKPSDCIYELYPLKNKNIKVVDTNQEDDIVDDVVEDVNQEENIDPHFPQAAECDTVFNI